LAIKETSVNTGLRLTFNSKKLMYSGSGYSGTPLAKKLGIKGGDRIKLINAPDHYFQLFSDLPANLNFDDVEYPKKNLIHFFTNDLHELLELLPQLKNQILQDGMIWVSWPKKSSKVKTDVTETDIRNYALSIGLVDIKVCAIDEVWSGLKMVIPVKDRKKGE
jgi:ABC-type lipoprotein release transport system permease subunit